MTKKILLVADEPHILRIMKLSIERAGFEVITAKNGVEGLACVYEQQPDAMIVDIEMPKMNGKEMCLKIHDEFPAHQIPIFIATSRAEDGFREWTDALPMVEFLEKPVSLRELTNKLKALFAETADAGIRVVGGWQLD